MLIKDISRIGRIAQAIDTNISSIAKQRLRKIESFNQLRKESCCEKSALKAIEVSRATIYRWKKRLKQKGLYGLEPASTRPRRFRKATLQELIRPQIIKIAKQFPTWGPVKLITFLKKNGTYASISTVARTLKKIPKSPQKKLIRQKIKRRRQFAGKHAQRWKYGMRGNKPGELIQMDHMTVNIAPGRTVKHFQATCPVTKVTVAKVYSSASSLNGARFLKEVQNRLPFNIQSIQVDGGSEFMSNFEMLCEKEQVPLFVLPPKSPKYNGCVERRNRTLREDFYSMYEGEAYLEDVNKKLNEYLQVYNEVRPHQAIGNLTPYEYLEQNWQQETI